MQILLLHALTLSILLCVSHGILKWVSIQDSGSYFSNLLEHWYWVVLALLVYGFVFFYYIFVLRSHAMSLLYPVYTSLSVLLVLLTGMLFFKESISNLQLAGIFFLAIGIGLISTQGNLS